MRITSASTSFHSICLRPASPLECEEKYSTNSSLEIPPDESTSMAAKTAAASFAVQEMAFCGHACVRARERRARRCAETAARECTRAHLQGGAELLDVDLPVAVYIDAVKERRRLHAGRLQFVRVGRHRRLGMRDDTAKQAEHVAHIGRLQLWKALQAPLEERVIGLHGPRPGPGRSGASQSGA